MSLTQLLLTSFLIAFTGALAPGPITAITMRYGAILGPSASLAISVGHGLVELAMIGALVKGLGTILKSQPKATRIIAFLGAMVMAWMAWGTFKEAWIGTAGLTLSGVSSVTTSTDGLIDSSRGFLFSSLFPAFTAGIAATLTNPYWVLWWATIGANYVLLAQTRGIAGLGAFFAGHISADVICFAMFALLASTGQQLFGHQFYRGLMLVLAVFLAILAVYFGRMALTGENKTV